MRFVIALLAFTAPAYAQSYVSILEKTYLENGISMEVAVKNNTLIIFGPLSKARVYQSITRLDVLAKAKEAGFKTVDFIDRGNDGRWTYDLTGPSIPKCDIRNRLCL